jgi:hypothetical protein
MSSKKRTGKGDPDISRDVEPSQPIPDNVGVEYDFRRQLAAVPALHETELTTSQSSQNESVARSVASQAENKRMRAAALAPSPHFAFQSDWTVRARTMAGQIHTIHCPDGSKTLIAHVKQELAQLDPKFQIHQQLRLLLPCEALLSDGIEPIDPLLTDDQTLLSCGVSNGGVVEVLMVDMVWSADCLELIEQFKQLENEDFLPNLDDNAVLALTWALVNAVC